MNSVFVGAYNDDFVAGNAADSAAGNQVQRQIFEEMKNLYGDESASSIRYRPHTSWPTGKLFIRSGKDKNSISVGFLNLPVLKLIVFSIRLLLHLRQIKASLIIKYNITASEALALNLYKRLNKNVFICVILQDIGYPQAGIRFPLGLLQWYAIHLCKSFDFIVPITPSIISDFRIPTCKTMVFGGGLTRQTKAALSLGDLESTAIKNIATFAGALEPYNGVELLVKRWIDEQIDIELHIFGKGSLEKWIYYISQTSSFIVYHGYVPEETVTKWQSSSRYNVCLRYSIGINQNYYYPSKLFNIVALRGVVVINDFANLPPGLRSLCEVADDKLLNLRAILLRQARRGVGENYAERRKWLLENCQWSSVISECDRRYEQATRILGTT